MIGVVGACAALSSCGTYQYVTPRQHVYGFDSSGNYAVNIDVYAPKTFGLGFSAAYALDDRWLVMGNGYYRLASRSAHSGEVFTFDRYNLSAEVRARGGGIGLGYYTKINAVNGFEFNMCYDFQRVDFDYDVTELTEDHDWIKANYNESHRRVYNAVIFQPTFYINEGNNATYITLGSRCKLYPFVYGSSSNWNPFESVDATLEPGLATRRRNIQFGIDMHVPLTRPFSYKAGNVSKYIYYEVPFNAYLRFTFGSQRSRHLRIPDAIK